MGIPKPYTAPVRYEDCMLNPIELDVNLVRFGIQSTYLTGSVYTWFVYYLIVILCMTIQIGA